MENFNSATRLAAQTTLRETIGGVSFDDLLFEREKIGASTREIIDLKTENWGVKVTAVEIRDITTPAALQEAMSRQAQAERERRARITLAEAEFQAAQKMVDAANLYSANPRAMEIRWMNILYELGLQGRGTLMLIPTNMPTAGAGSSQPVPQAISSQPTDKQDEQNRQTQKVATVEDSDILSDGIVRRYSDLFHVFGLRQKIPEVLTRFGGTSKTGMHNYTVPAPSLSLALQLRLAQGPWFCGTATSPIP